MKKILLIFSISLITLLLSCKDDELLIDEVLEVTENSIKPGVLTSNQTWSSDTIYILQNRVIVPDGITLTIEAGTLIKGKEGQGAEASVLIVAQGGKIQALGTSSNPIIFTSILDELEVGSIVGTLSGEDKELWGGIIILGKAPISAASGDTESLIEGLPADESYGKYGGFDSKDNSGILEYVSIRHGGIIIGEGNEINGLTLGGVGSGTTINNVEIYATKDDGIELFGGSVNINNLIVSYQGDDGIDIDQNYEGMIENFVVLHGGSDTDEGLEIDGPENSTYKNGLFNLKNGLCRSLGGITPGTPADLKAKAQGGLSNIIFDYGTNNILKIRASYNSTSDCSKTSDAFSNLLDLKLIIAYSLFDSIAVYSNTSGCDATIFNQDEAASHAVPFPTATGANISVFKDWTLASATSIL